MRPKTRENLSKKLPIVKENNGEDFFYSLTTLQTGMSQPKIIRDKSYGRKDQKTFKSIFNLLIIINLTESNYNKYISWCEKSYTKRAKRNQ